MRPVWLRSRTLGFVLAGFLSLPFPVLATGRAPTPVALRWWENSTLVRSVGLSEAQIRDLEAAVVTGRPETSRLRAELVSEQARFKELQDAEPPPVAALRQHAERLAAARRAVSEAEARLLIAVRAKLSHAQWEELRRVEKNSPADALVPPAPPVAPLGTWWKAPLFKDAMALPESQSAELERVFHATLPAILAARERLEREETALGPLVDAAVFDGARTLQQARTIAEAREQLERVVLGMRIDMQLKLTADERKRYRVVRDMYISQGRRASERN